jgi:hypothetical protein
VKPLFKNKIVSVFDPVRDGDEPADGIENSIQGRYENDSEAVDSPRPKPKDHLKNSIGRIDDQEYDRIQ